MPPNGTSRKTPAASAGSKIGGTNFIPKSLLETLFTDTDKKTKVKLKSDQVKSLPKPSKPGNWDSDLATTKPTTRPITVPIEEIALAFPTGHPLSDIPDLLKCSHCKRAILRHRAKDHISTCIAKKQERQRKKKEAKDARDAAARRIERGGLVSSDSSDAEGDADGDTITLAATGGATGRKTARKTEAVGAGQAGKKRKADDGPGGAKKKKVKLMLSGSGSGSGAGGAGANGVGDDTPGGAGGKAKGAKQKAPVDVEKQCGVELPQGGQCARSLTCKSHSMGAKRAVPGRSAPYDKLLAEYQRKNQAKLQKAAMDSLLAPEPDAALDGGPVDSDEEKDLVLAAIARSRPAPLFQPQLVPLRRRYAFVRLKEMLGNAIGGGGGTSATGSGPGGTAPANGARQDAGPSANGTTSGGGQRGSISVSDAGGLLDTPVMSAAVVREMSVNA